VSHQKHTTIRYKVTLSYLILVLLAATAISILYKGIHNIIILDTDSTKPNYKIKYINKILANVYEAEGFSRSYFLFRNDSDLIKYINLSDVIDKSIDSLKIICQNNSNQLTNLNEIDTLFSRKHLIIGQLVFLNKSNNENLSYSRVVDEFYLGSYENLTQPVVIKSNTTITHDSIYDPIVKKGLVNKVKRLVSSSKKYANNQLTKTTVEEVTSYDTIYQPVRVNRNVIQTLRKALNNFKNRTDFEKQQSVSQETQLLHSDRVILERIRSVIASMETEEFIHTSKFLDKSREIIRQANYSVILLGILAMILVFVFLYIIYRDIARSKAYETELMKARQHSEDLVKLKEQFVASVSHEIRTPLSAIVGLSEQLRKTQSADDQSVCIENIAIASRNLHALVNNVLDISKNNAGKLQLENIAFNFEHTISEIYRVFTNEAARKNIELQLHLDASCNNLIYGDKYRLSQIVTNIVNNAIKFTDKGMVDVIAKLTRTEDDNFEAEIIVFDTGIGIPSEKLHSIFDEFTQASSSTTRIYGGTGLGLSIVKNIVELMDGSIHVESKLNQGSTFVIRIPFKKSDIHEIDTVSYVEDLELLRKLKFLIVEDDETLRILLNQIFISNNLVGEIVGDAEEALKVVKSENFDIVFTDLQMPGLSGIDLCKELNLFYNNQVPVIAFSARDSISGEFEDYGFAGFLPKPFSEMEFFQVILDVIHAENNNILINKYPELIDNSHVEPEFSLHLLQEFTKGDNDSLKRIVNSFLDNTDNSLKLFKDCIANNDVDKISKIAHKMIPMFKQFQITGSVDTLIMLERYNELGLIETDVILFTEGLLESIPKVIAKIKEVARV
jgi:signal transduction histidine kinase/CheY-like chemotaxis protein